MDERMIDILYVTHNRREFTLESFSALVANTNWDMVARLCVIDDRSTDGTYEMMVEAVRDAACPTFVTTGTFGGPVAALNHGLDRTKSEYVAKIDSDVIVCPGWLEAMHDVMEESPRLDAVGMEPGFARPYPNDLKRKLTIIRPQPISVLAGGRTWKPARWIGGVGLFRRRVFQKRRPKQNDRFFGLTAFWRSYAKTGWVDPDLPVFLLDHLPFEPWRSLTQKYVSYGWARAWPDEDLYREDQRSYWDWWTPVGVELVA